MTTSRSLLALALAVGLVSGSLFAATPAAAPSSTPAATAPAKTGSVSGKVLDKDGKPAKDVQIRFMVAPAGGAAAPGGGRNGGGRNGGGRGGPANATTDDKGAYTIKNVPVGQVNINASGPMPTDGTPPQRARTAAPVEVKENAETKVDDLKLADAPARGGAPGGPGGGRGARGGRGAPPATAPAGN